MFLETLSGKDGFFWRYVHVEIWFKHAFSNNNSWLDL